MNIAGGTGMYHFAPPKAEIRGSRYDKPSLRATRKREDRESRVTGVERGYEKRRSGKDHGSTMERRDEQRS